MEPRTLLHEYCRAEASPPRTVGSPYRWGREGAELETMDYQEERTKWNEAASDLG
jgi:hypothetical protein